MMRVNKKTGRREWGWRVRAKNGRNVGPGGEGFGSRRDAERAFDAHVVAIANAVRIIVD